MQFFRKAQASPAMQVVNFRFFDGSLSTPEEYGEIACKVGWKGAIEEVTSTLGQNSRASGLGLCKALSRRALHAALEIQMLKTGIYLWYAASVLKVNANTVERISNGIKIAMRQFNIPGGSKFDEEFIEIFLYRAREFALKLEEDDQFLSTREIGTFTPNSLPSTELLIDHLCSATGVPESSIQDLRNEIANSPNGWWLRNMLEASTIGNIKALSNELKVSLELSTR